MTGVGSNFAPEHALMDTIDCRLTYSAIRLLQDIALSYQLHATEVKKLYWSGQGRTLELKTNDKEEPNLNYETTYIYRIWWF